MGLSGLLMKGPVVMRCVGKLKPLMCPVILVSLLSWSSWGWFKITGDPGNLAPLAPLVYHSGLGQVAQDDQDDRSGCSFPAHCTCAK